jgi:hypothetical protein
MEMNFSQNFSAKNFFVTIFLAEKDFLKNLVFQIFLQHTHIKSCVCVDDFSVKNENFKLKAVCFTKKEMKNRGEKLFRLKAV